MERVKGRAVSKTSHSQPLQRASHQSRQSLESLQPWLHDRYAALRAETGPRWQQTRAVVVPVITDTSHKVRDELVPAAAHLSSRVAEEAMARSAPLRAEVSDRAVATLAAARGQVSAAQLGQLKRRHNGQNGHSHRKLWFIGGAAAVSAALGTAAVLWQRSRYQAWVEDEAVHDTIDETPDPDRLNSDDPNHSQNHNHTSDAAGDAHASSAGRHREDNQ